MTVKDTVYKTFFCLIIIAAFFCLYCNNFPGFAYNLEGEHLLIGKAMGTSWHITIYCPKKTKDIAPLENLIKQRIAQIEKSMSSYIKDSELNRFNSFGKGRFEASPDFYNVMTIADNIYRLTKGAWDPSVRELVDLWGFGSLESPDSLPSKNLPLKEDIRKLVKKKGFNYIEILEAPFILKKDKDVKLDLGSIAKGFAVDQIALAVKNYGIENFLIEIGGEVKSSGTRKNQKPWIIGINLPEIYALPDTIYRSVILKDNAMATSGTYRNFFEKDGLYWSHIIDPATGYPVQNKIVSVSIIAESCTFADGLATGITVMGAESGIALADKLEKIEAYVITRQADGSLFAHCSKGFKDFIIP